MNSDEINERINGKKFPTVNMDLIQKKIKDKKFIFDGVLTICILTLENGFKVFGKSACAHPENFDKELGEAVAFEDAKSQIWELEGYLLKQRLFENVELYA